MHRGRQPAPTGAQGRSGHPRAGGNWWGAAEGPKASGPRRQSSPRRKKSSRGSGAAEPTHGTHPQALQTAEEPLRAGAVGGPRHRSWAVGNQRGPEEARPEAEGLRGKPRPGRRCAAPQPARESPPPEGSALGLSPPRLLEAPLATWHVAPAALQSSAAPVFHHPMESGPAGEGPPPSAQRGGGGRAGGAAPPPISREAKPAAWTPSRGRVHQWAAGGGGTKASFRPMGLRRARERGRWRRGAAARRAGAPRGRWGRRGGRGRAGRCRGALPGGRCGRRTRPAGVGEGEGEGRGDRPAPVGGGGRGLARGRGGPPRALPASPSP